MSTLSIELPPGLDPFVLEPIHTPDAELVATFFARTVSLKQATIDHLLLQHGVPVSALCHDPDEVGWAICQARIVIDETGLFEFAHADDEQATEALAVVARDVSGDAVDIIAWAPRVGRVVTHLGRASLLGAQNINGYSAGEPLAIHKSVIGWLRASRSGAVVINAKRAALLLRDAVRDLAVEDDAHSREIAALLVATVDLSRIVVPKPCVAALEMEPA